LGLYLIPPKGHKIILHAYPISFLDNHLRYITSLGLYRSQTAEHVLEIYRRGVTEYGVPREMLTDNGRQYTNWRGKTRFEREMKKDRGKHIRSRPHHPMTLGKIERFWKSIQNEFLFRAQFDSFEQAAERTAYRIKYYNYKHRYRVCGACVPKGYRRVILCSSRWPGASISQCELRYGHLGCRTLLHPG
jgi:transposase InsO family protein